MRKGNFSNPRKIYYEKKEVLLVKSKLNQQNRNNEGKINKQQIVELIKK